MSIFHNFLKKLKISVNPVTKDQQVKNRNFRQIFEILEKFKIYVNRLQRINKATMFIFFNF